MHEDKVPLQVFFTISLLGFWLIASTVTFEFQSPLLIYSNLFCGVLLIFFGLKSRKNPTNLEIWFITALGIWLQFSPLIFWAPTAAGYVNDTFIGCWVIALCVTLHPMPGHTFCNKATIPPGWSYNPSDWTQRLPIAFLAFLCWVIARYLAAYQLGYIDTVWEPFFTPGTKSVLESSVSKAFPVSDAGLGALAYTIEFFSACQGGTNRWRTAPWLVLVFGILVIPVGIVSTILIILQPLAVGTWCTLCLATGICMLISIPFAIAEVTATLQFLRHSKEKPLLQLLFHGGNCPQETPDHRSLPMDRPILSLLHASLSGITLPWNLLCSALLGIILMAIPTILGLQGLLYNIDPILGALTVLVSIIALAECARQSRWINPILSIALLAAAWISQGEYLLLHTLIALAIICLNFRKGPIREQFTYRP